MTYVLVYSGQQEEKMGGSYAVMAGDQRLKFTTIYREAVGNYDCASRGTLAPWPGGLEEIQEVFNDAVIVGRMEQAPTPTKLVGRVPNRGVAEAPVLS